MDNSSPPPFLLDIFPDTDIARRNKRPFVTLTYAQSLDGCIAGHGGTQILLSGRESMVMTHWMRTMHDGILIGLNTVMNDNPQLNTRHLPPKDSPYPQPRPIILDTSLRAPLDCKLIVNYRNGTGIQPWIICARPKSLTGLGSPATQQRDERRALLEAAGARVLEVGMSEEKVDLQEALGVLAELGLQSIMVEGGARVISNFLGLRDEEGTPIVDVNIVTVAPTLIGATGISATGALEKPPKLEPIASAIFGKDAMFAFRSR